MALAADGSCSYLPALTTLRGHILAGAATYVEGNPGRAAKLAIFVSAIGQDPTDFGGLDLIQAVAGGVAADGTFGGYASAFNQSLAIIALSRAGAPVPGALVTKLLSFQGAEGAFGYEWGGTFTTDPDSTALAIMALAAVGGQTAHVDAAVDWALANQTAQGYWENYSPIDSTALLASALHLIGQDNAAAVTWLADRQLPDGGFPNSLDAGTPSDRTSTAAAMWAATGTSLVSVTFNLAACAATPSRTAIPTTTAPASAMAPLRPSGSGQPSRSASETSDPLASTGGSEALLPLGVAGLGLVALGALALVPRRRMHS